jgi:hypothetical protein
VTPRPICLALVLSLAGCASPPSSALCSDAEAAAGCAISTQLLFGLSRPDGVTVSEGEWRAFLAETATPLFPAGFTVLAAEGQWRQDAKSPSETATIIREPARLVLIVHGDAGDEGRIAELIADYKTRFQQQSVLRLDVKAIARF